MQNCQMLRTGAGRVTVDTVLCGKIYDCFIFLNTFRCEESAAINIDCTNPALTLESLTPLSCSSFATYQKAARSHELHRLKHLAEKE